MDSSAVLLSDVQEKGIGILGMGVSGGAVIERLKSALPTLGTKIPLFLRDKNSALSCPPSLAGLPRVFCRFGENWLEDISEAVLFRSPVIRPDLPPLTKAVKQGAILTSEVAWTNALCPARMFLITGSDGKTSTASMLYAMLRCKGERQGFSAYLGGNIGTPLLESADKMKREDCAVFELSSFQLLDTFPKSEVATVLNITPNHLDIHTSLREYIDAKNRIFKNAHRKVIHPHCPHTLDFLSSGDVLCSLFLTEKERKQEFGNRAAVGFDGEWVYFSEGNTHLQLFSKDDLQILGQHQLQNAMTAAAMALEIASPQDIQKGIRGFRGVPHRLQMVAKYKGIPCFDSSIDTTPARVEATLSAMKGKPTVICGGSDKGLDYLPLAYTLLRRAGRVVVTGETAPKILEALKKTFKEEKKSIAVFYEKDFTQSVKTAAEQTPVGEALVLSPGCASFDMFANYKARASAFLEILKSMGATPVN